MSYQDKFSVKKLAQKTSVYWQKAQEAHLLKSFHDSSNKVPGYKNFLKKKKVEPKSIRSYEDFKSLPIVTRAEYLKSYSLEALVQKGTLVQPTVITSTSGSTGAPIYFPRNKEIDLQSAIMHRLFIETSKIKKDKSTLVIIGFGMGVWIGGLITYQAFKYLSEWGYPFSILTPGVNKKEIYEALKNIGHHYDQIILAGYPPFVKDVVDDATASGVNWKKFDLRIIFAAESFSEEFRDYIIRKTGIKNTYRDTMNIYGSADLGTMAEETPLTILVRRLALKNKNIYRKLFVDATRLPTLAQYIPEFDAFEARQKNIYITASSALPLVRYEIGDNGGVITFAEVDKIFKEEGVDLKREAARVGITDTITELPFVYIYERTDLSTKLYGAIIYPEYIKSGLEHSTLEGFITGRFTAFTEHNNKQDEYLEINVELKSGVQATGELKAIVTQTIYDSLMKRSAEYQYLSGTIKDRIMPHVVFWPHEDPLYFKTAGKQKWVKK